MYDGYVSPRTGELVLSPDVASFATPLWAQKMHTLDLKPLSFRSRAHSEEEWRQVARLLKTIGDLQTAWIEWTIVSCKELNGVNVSPELAKRLEFVDECGDSEFIINGLEFTKRQCSKRMLKPREEQVGDYARAHFVPDAPLANHVKFRNALYKKVCRNIWDRIDVSKEDGAQCLFALKRLASEDMAMKETEIVKRNTEQKIEARENFESWKTMKDATRVDNKVMLDLKQQERSELGHALSSDRPVPFRYVGSGVLSAEEAGAGYMRAANRLSLPQSGSVITKLNSKAPVVGMWAVKSQNQQNPYEDVEHANQQLSEWESMLATEHEFETQRNLLSEQEFANWENSVLYKDAAMRCLSRINFVKRCLYNNPHGPLGGLECWCTIGEVLVSIDTKYRHSAPVFDKWVNWTQSNTLKVFSSPILLPMEGRFVSCRGSIFNSDSAVLRLDKTETAPPGSLLLVLAAEHAKRDKIYLPMSPESMMLHLDKHQAMLAVVDTVVGEALLEANEVYLRGGMSISEALGDSCVVYLVPNIIAHLFFGLKVPNSLLNLVKDKEQISCRIRSFCRSQRRKFATTFRWFNDKYSNEEETYMLKELSFVKRVCEAELLRSNVTQDFTIRLQVRALWQAVDKNPALHTNSICLPGLNGAVAQTHQLDDTGRPLAQMMDVRLSEGDYVCTITDAKRDTWYQDKDWAKITDFSCARNKIHLDRGSVRGFRSSGDGSLIYRILLDDFEPVDSAIEQLDVLCLSEALVLRFLEEQNRFVMFLMPNLRTYGDLNEMQAWAKEDSDDHKHIRQKMSSNIAMEEALKNIALCKKCFTKIQSLIEDNPSKNDSKFEKLGQLLFKFSCIVDHFVADERLILKEELDSQAWLMLWITWMESSGKWKELNSLGFEKDDVMVMARRKWSQFGRKIHNYSTHLDIEKSTYVVFHQIKSILV